MRGEPAGAWDSGNGTIEQQNWKEYTDIAFVLANGLILFVTSTVGIAANLFVILAVYHQKSLQTSINALVVNLAVIDILRCAFDCPVLLTIVVTVYRRGRADAWICDTQVASFSFSCCIQMLTLACISAERHQAIAQPFKTEDRRRRITVLIPLTWTFSILMAGNSLFLKDSPVHVKCKGLAREESSSNDTLGLYMLFPLWAVCFGTITGFYTRIFSLVKSHNRKIFDQGTFPAPTKDKREENPKIAETTIVENETRKAEQDQTLGKSVALVEPVTQAEPDSSKKDNTPAPLTSAKPPQCVSVSPENIKALKKALVITDLETEQPRPPVMQEIAVNSGEKPFKTEPSNPCSTKAEDKPSSGVAVAGVKSSAAKPQKVSGNFDTERQSKEGAKTNTAPSEMKEPEPRVPTPARRENPKSTSLLLIAPKQAKSSNGEETLAVAAVNQVSSLAPVSINVPDAEATKQSAAAVEGAVCMMPSKQSRERANKSKESKMAKRAGYIIVTFLLFWLPLITTVLVNFLVHKNKSKKVTFVQDLEVLSVSVACITSLSDPIIYAAVNPQFRTEFHRIKNQLWSEPNKRS